MVNNKAHEMSQLRKGQVKIGERDICRDKSAMKELLRQSFDFRSRI